MRPLILLIPAALALSQPNSPAESKLPLSMKRAVEISLAPEGSPRVALAQESIKEAEAKRLEARGALLPDLETSLSDRRQTTNLRAYGFNFAIPIPGVVLPTIVGPFSVFDARATASQTVF